MLRVFRKGLDCLHELLSCKCTPEPMVMTVRTAARPTADFIVLCAVMIAHGRPYLRGRFPYVDDALERRIQVATGYGLPRHVVRTGKPGLSWRGNFLIHPDGRIADRDDRTVGQISKL